MGAEKTLLSKEHAYVPSFSSDCSKGFEAELTPSAPQAPAACPVQAQMGLAPASSKQDGSQKNPKTKSSATFALSLKVEAVGPWIPMHILNDACLLN